MRKRFSFSFLSFHVTRPRSPRQKKTQGLNRLNVNTDVEIVSNIAAIAFNSITPSKSAPEGCRQLDISTRS